MENKTFTNASIKTAAHWFNRHLNEEAFDTDKTDILESLKKSTYKYAIITHCILMLSIFKEEILSKDGDSKLALNIPEPVFEKLLGNLIVKNGDKFQVGEITLETKLEILELIRNKLLHGDYYIDLPNKQVVLKAKDLKGPIAFNDLYELCRNLVGAVPYKLKGVENRPMVLYKGKNNDLNPLNSMYDLKKLFKRTYFIEFIEEPEEGFVRTPEAVLLLQEFYQSLHTHTNELKQKKIKNYIKEMFEKYEDKLKKHHIKLTYKIHKVASLPEYEKLKEIFKTNRIYLKYTRADFRKRYMVQIASNMLAAQKNEHLQLVGSIDNNIGYLTNHILSIPNNIETLRNNSSFTAVDDMRIAGLLNLFYSTYHYPLDEILSNGANTSLRNIVVEDNLNFAKLNIDKLYDPNMTIDVSFKDIPNQLPRMIKKIPEYEAITKNNFTNLHNFSKSKNQPEGKELFLSCKTIISIIQKEYEKENCVLAKQFLENDFEKYIINYNIIAHIRNALAHGNIRIKPYVEGDTYDDREIIIEDIFDQLFTPDNMFEIDRIVNCKNLRSQRVQDAIKNYTITKK